MINLIRAVVGYCTKPYNLVVDKDGRMWVPVACTEVYDPFKGEMVYNFPDAPYAYQGVEINYWGKYNLTGPYREQWSPING